MNPKWQHLFGIYTRLSYVRVASYTSHTLPCLNTKQVAVKVTSKDQQPLIKSTPRNLYARALSDDNDPITYRL